ncbi:hypothetical protein [Rhizohabitans arisaemae]|uniref:hypothetical protein n=1 Tax=Rhizohabitans arisaemae TaxID=2720610 RepID=UPI0024B0C10E|nr:hypothetical protein [Rhizohabitans arisaemae]
MTTRFAGVLVTPGMAAAAPVGTDRSAFLSAVAEDVYELLAGLESVTPVLVTAVPGLEEITWPGTPVIDVAGEPDPVRAGFAGMAGLGAADADPQAVLVAADAPDLPALLIGKLFRGLGGREVAICPDQRGAPVALAARLPLPGWVEVGFETDQALVRLRAAAPGPRRVYAGPGWHRLREPADLRRLDVGLEGWEQTRALLGGAPLSR